MNKEIVPMTNAIRVKMKKKEYVLFKKYLDTETRTLENASIYDLAKYMVDVLPKDIERFESLAIFDEMIKKAGNNAPQVLRIGNSETLNDLYNKYAYAYKITPNKPLLKELTELYKELLDEELNN